MGRRRREIRGRTRNKYKKQKGVLSFARFFFFPRWGDEIQKSILLVGLKWVFFFSVPDPTFGGWFFSIDVRLRIYGLGGMVVVGVQAGLGRGRAGD